MCFPPRFLPVVCALLAVVGPVERAHKRGEPLDRAEYVRAVWRATQVRELSDTPAPRVYRVRSQKAPKQTTSHRMAPATPGRKPRLVASRGGSRCWTCCLRRWERWSPPSE